VRRSVQGRQAQENPFFLLPLAIPIVLTGVGVGGYMLYQSTSSADTAPASGGLDALLAQSSVKGTEQKLRNTKIIIDEFIAAGFPFSLALAAVVNAAAESALNEMALAGAPGEDSVGLFQLNACCGGKGMSTAQRQDPVLNTRRIISELKAAINNTSGYDKSLGRTVPVESISSALRRHATVAELAGLFGFHVERPKALTASLTTRATLARQMFPTMANLPGHAVDAMYSGSKWLLYGSIAAAVSLVGLGLYLRRRRA